MYFYRTNFILLTRYAFLEQVLYLFILLKSIFRDNISFLFYLCIFRDNIF